MVPFFVVRVVFKIWDRFQILALLKVKEQGWIQEFSREVGDCQYLGGAESME